jgi:hypothetical protein
MQLEAIPSVPVQVVVFFRSAQYVCRIFTSLVPGHQVSQCRTPSQSMSALRSQVSRSMHSFVKANAGATAAVSLHSRAQGATKGRQFPPQTSRGLARTSQRMQVEQKVGLLDPRQVVVAAGPSAAMPWRCFPQLPLALPRVLVVAPRTRQDWVCPAKATASSETAPTRQWTPS